MARDFPKINKQKIPKEQEQKQTQKKEEEDEKRRVPSM